MQKRLRTTGGVIGPGQPILDSVPQNTELLIDARVGPVDIDEVAAGQQACVHFRPTSRRAADARYVIHLTPHLSWPSASATKLVS